MLKFQIIAKATLDAAGLQVSEASRIGRLRRGLEHAARQRHLAGDQVANIIGNILPYFSSMLGIVLHVPLDPEADGCGLPLRKNSEGSRHCCHFSRATLPVLGRHGSLLQMPRVVHTGARESRAACVIQWIRQRQVWAERWRFCAEVFISARRSAFGRA